MKKLMITREDLPNVFKYKHPTVSEKEGEFLMTVAFYCLYGMFGLSLAAALNGWPI